MKRLWFPILLGLAGLGRDGALAGQSSLEMMAARQEVQEFIRSTNTRLRDLEESVKNQQSRLVELEEENRKLRQELLRLSRSDPAAGLAEDFKRLAADIKEVDQKRLSDNKLTTEQLKRIQSLVESFAKSGPAKPPPEPVDFGNADLNAYEVEAGDTLTKIVAKLRAAGYTVTQQSIQQANPSVVWTRLQIGQKLVIPVSKD